MTFHIISVKPICFSMRKFKVGPRRLGAWPNVLLMLQPCFGRAQHILDDSYKFITVCQHEWPLSGLLDTDSFNRGLISRHQGGTSLFTSLSLSVRDSGSWNHTISLTNLWNMEEIGQLLTYLTGTES